MDVRSALVQLRKELKMRQVDLAAELGVSSITLNRWETGKNSPNRAMSLAIVAYASSHGASTVCQEALRSALFKIAEKPGIDSLKFAQVDQINNLVNDSSNAVFVCDAKTYKLLYVNRQLGRITGKPVESAAGKKCYEYIFDGEEPCEFCGMGRIPTGEFCTKEYESPVSGNYYMARSKMTIWDGRKAHIEFITDMTAFHKARRELAHNRELVSAACKQANMWVFSYDIQSGTAYLEQAIQNTLKLPDVVPDFFELLCRSGGVYPEYLSELGGIPERLKNGEATVTMSARTNFDGVRPHWVRFIANTVEFEGDGRPSLAVCSAQLIDNEKALESKIRFEHERIIASNPDLMGYAISNITKNVIMKCSGLRGESFRIPAELSFDEAVKKAAAQIEPAGDRERFARAHDRGALLEGFSEEDADLSIDFQLRRPDDMLIWMHNELKLSLNPVSGDIYLYEYCFAAHTQTIMEGLLAEAMQNEYEMLGAVSMLNGQMTRLNFDAEKNGSTREPEFVPYAEDLREYCLNKVAPDNQAEFMKKTDLENVRERLKNSGTYRIAFRSNGTEGNSHKKVAQFTWYDAERQFCLLSVMNLNQFLASADDLDAPEGKKEN